MTPGTAHADFVKRGSEFAVAYEILARGCDVPPSLEIFDHELQEARKRNSALAPAGMARRLSESYHRVKGLFGGDD